VEFHNESSRENRLLEPGCFLRERADREFDCFVQRNGIQGIDEHMKDIFSENARKAFCRVRRSLELEEYDSEQI
jgi:hypothetical protein